MFSFYKIHTKKYGSFQSGFTLLETLVAIFMFSLALTSLMAVASRGVTTTRSAINQTIAQFLAQEGIELVQNVRDSNMLNTDESNVWTDNLIPNCEPENNAMTRGGCYVGAIQTLGLTRRDTLAVLPCPERCPNLSRHPDYGFYTYGNMLASVNVEESIYRRTIFIVPSKPGNSGGDDDYYVISRVEWTDGRTNRSVEVSKNIFNWFQKPQE